MCLRKVEHRQAANDSLLMIGYEYTYDLLGRVERSVERPSGDTTVYTYTPAGRLESEVREGQVRYSRYYGYNLDGSRAMVMRDDALNGAHWDVYAYDPVSGRLASVQDALTGEVYNFVWNPEGTLARWENNAPNGYARVFGYDEEGRLVKIERDYGSGGVQVAYEYGYNSDGARVWKRDVLNEQEYRYVCRIGCGGVPMRVYNRPMSGGSWNTLEEYLDAPTVQWYGAGANSYSNYSSLGGYLLSSWGAQLSEMVCADSQGEIVNFHSIRLPEEVMGDFDPAALGRLRELICRFLPFLCKKKPKPKPKPDPVYEGCIAICNAYAQYCRGLGFAGPLCSRIAQLGCEKMCRDIKDAKYFEDCSTPCKGLPTDSQCVECCTRMCQGLGLSSYKICENACYGDVMPRRGYR